MIAKFAFEDFPITKEQCENALQVVAQHIHNRYRSPFTLVLVLPQSLWVGKMLETYLTNDKAMPITVGLGVMPTLNEEGKLSFAIIEPPSIHSIRNRKCVVFDAQGDWGVTLAACNFVKQLHPAAIEVAALLSRGPVPSWVNADYVAFEVPSDIVVSGLGLGYNNDKASGGMLVADVYKTQEESPNA